MEIPHFSPMVWINIYVKSISHTHKCIIYIYIYPRLVYISEISPLKPNGSNGLVIEDRSQGLELTEQELFEVPGASREKEIKHMSLGELCHEKV